MPVYAIVPVQRLDSAKTRLASILSAAERQRLVVELLDNVLAALKSSDQIAGAIVVSPDMGILDRAMHADAIPVEQRGRGLNEAIRLGRERAVGLGADGLLIVLADLPKLTTSEIDRLVSTSEKTAVTLAPDRHGHGTNAMILRPPTAIEPAFGIDSFHIHRSEAQRIGLSTKVFRSTGTAFDIDTIDDLTDLDRCGEDHSWRLESGGQRTIVSALGKVFPTRDGE